MLLSEEQQKEFTPEQIAVIDTAYTAKETEFNALANKNTDGILNGVADKLNTITGIPRNGDKEQVTSYFERLSNDWLPEASKGKIAAIESERDEWKTKFESHKGDETLKAELQKAQEEVAKIPELLSAKENEWSTKYGELEKTHNQTKLNRSILDGLPKFDENVNKFELEAKKNSAIERIKANYELSYDENDNLIGTKDYQKTLVSELLKSDEELKDLILTEQEKGGGGGAGQKKTKALNIPEAISKGAAQQLVREFMITVEGIDNLDPKYSDRFKELCKENNVL